MSQTTLYRKWRPRALGEVSGQEPVVRTLRRAIETGRVSHAYLFSGPRGTGKTSTAKALAMGMNCLYGPTPEPCGECESCRAIMGSSSMDVLEMDAASNRGIDEIRELRDRVSLAPASGRVKVYIIDEVHMLTPEAFNALLKMLEEPPEHVIFVLATTEKHRVPPTIVSRCQSFDFRRPGVDTLVEKLSEIATAEGIEAEPEALTAIAREAGGSFRDAEGLLDQLSSFAEGEVTAALVREMLGSVGLDMLLQTTDALHERRAADALRAVDQLSREGRDMGRFATEMISHLRTLMLLPHAPDVALAEVGAEERAPLEEQANKVSTAEVVRLIEALGETRSRTKRGGDPKLELELTFLKLARDYTEPSTEALMSRLETLETALENGEITVSSRPEAQPEKSQPSVEVPNEPEVDVEGVENERLESDSLDESAAKADDSGTGLASGWRDIMQVLEDRRQATAATIYGEEARVARFDREVLELEVEDRMLDLARGERNLEPLRDAIEYQTGVRPRVELRGARERLSSSEPETEHVSESHRTGSDGGSEVATETTSDSGTEHIKVGETASGEEAADADDTIRDESEAFKAVQEQFGLMDSGGR